MQNENNLLNLIEAVKRCPKLYTNLSGNAHFWKEWTGVAQQCKMTTAEAQDQWNLLLMEYMVYLKSNQDFNLAEHMDFLQPYFFTITDDRNIDELELLDAIDYKAEAGNNIKCSEIVKDDKNIENSNDIEKELEFGQKEKVDQTDETKSTTFIKNKEPKSTCESSENPQYKSTENRQASFTNLSPMELIFLGYAKQLQRMPLAVQLKTKRKIADIIDEAELQAMNTNNI